MSRNPASRRRNHNPFGERVHTHKCTTRCCSICWWVKRGGQPSNIGCGECPHWPKGPEALWALRRSKTGGGMPAPSAKPEPRP